MIPYTNIIHPIMWASSLKDSFGILNKAIFTENNLDIAKK